MIVLRRLAIALPGLDGVIVVTDPCLAPFCVNRFH